MVVSWSVVGLSTKWTAQFGSLGERVSLAVQEQLLCDLVTPCDRCGMLGAPHYYNGNKLCEIDYKVSEKETKGLKINTDS